MRCVFTKAYRWLATVTTCGFLVAGCVSVQPAWGQELPQGFQPTDDHKLLKKDVGTWDAEMKMYMGGPDAEPMILPATETNSMMRNGLWLLSDFKSGPFMGHGQFGYDPIKKKYVGTWIDNMAPHLSTMEGSFDKSTGEMTMYSTGINPETGKPEKMKSVTKYESDDSKSMVMYKQTDDGKWVKSFEIQYKRTAS